MRVEAKTTRVVNLIKFSTGRRVLGPENKKGVYPYKYTPKRLFVNRLLASYIYRRKPDFIG
jgi:hypothetical protein